MDKLQWLFITKGLHASEHVVLCKGTQNRDLFLPLLFVLFIYWMKSSKGKRGVCFESCEMQMSSAELPRRNRLCIFQKTHRRSRPQRESVIQLAVWTRTPLSHQPSVSLPTTSIIATLSQKQNDMRLQKRSEKRAVWWSSRSKQHRTRLAKT